MNVNSAKLDKFEKATFKNMKAYFEADKNPVKFYQTDNVTLAVAKHKGSCKFNRVAVSYRAPLDGFSKKRGKFEALKRLDNDVFMLVPIDFCVVDLLDMLDAGYFPI